MCIYTYLIFMYIYTYLSLYMHTYTHVFSLQRRYLFKEYLIFQILCIYSMCICIYTDDSIHGSIFQIFIYPFNINVESGLFCYFLKFTLPTTNSKSYENRPFFGNTHMGSWSMGPFYHFWGPPTSLRVPGKSPFHRQVQTPMMRRWYRRGMGPNPSTKKEGL